MSKISSIDSSVMPVSSSFKVLIVEDDEDQRFLLCEMLHLLGYNAHAVANAEEAFEAIEKDDFNILIADVDLPKISGIDMARTVLKQRPYVKVIFATGHGYLVTNRTDFDFVLLHKPYHLMQLKDVVENMRNNT